MLAVTGECPWPSKQVQYELLMYKQCPVEEDDRSRDPTFDLPGAFKFRCGRLGTVSIGFFRDLQEYCIGYCSLIILLLTSPLR